MRSGNAGTRDVEAAYEVQGLNWAARYLLELADNDSTAVFSGSAVVGNAASHAFDHARITLVSGQMATPPKRLRLSTDQRVTSAGITRNQASYLVGDNLGMGEQVIEYQAPAIRVDVSSKSMRMGRATEVSSEHQQLFGLQLYTLPLETSLPDGIEKEYSLFAPATIKTRTSYEYAYWKHPSQVGVFARTVNTDSVGLGMPLPSGPVKIYRTREGGAAEYVGEDRLAAVAKNDPLFIRLGFAEGLSVIRTALASEEKWNGRRDDTWEVRIRNDRDSEVRLDVLEQFGEKWKVLEASAPHATVTARLIKFPVTVAAESEYVLTYKLRTQRAWKK